MREQLSWAKGEIDSNCYEYAFGDIRNTDEKYFKYEYKQFMERKKEFFSKPIKTMKDIPSKRIPGYYRVIYMIYYRNGQVSGFHFVREDSDGGWSDSIPHRPPERVANPILKEIDANSYYDNHELFLIPIDEYRSNIAEEKLQEKLLQKKLIKNPHLLSLLKKILVCSYTSIKRVA